MNVCKYDFGVRTSTHRPKYGLWLGLYIIIKLYLLILMVVFQGFEKRHQTDLSFFQIIYLTKGCVT